MDLSHISRTAILLLICRAVEAEKNKAQFADPMAVLCLDRLISIAPEEDKRWILRKKRMYEGVHERDAKAGVQKGLVFDNAVNRFITEHPQCTVINLACGFDTRFWRIKNDSCKYIELDLPEVITLKKELLQDNLCYELISCSVLKTSWIDQVTSGGNSGFLLIAEGLFMWLTKTDVTILLKDIDDRFVQSQLILDIIPERYTRGFWRSLFRLHSRIEWGLDVEWLYGIKDPHDLEAFGNSLQVISIKKGSVGPIITLSINADNRSLPTNPI